MAIKCYKKLVYDSRPIQTNSFIIIHNSAGGVAEGVYSTFIDNKNSGSEVCAHYAVDDNNIIKLLEDNWNGQHTTGSGYYKEWGTKAEGVNNSNSIGIEIADGAQVNMNVAIDNAIELTRHLMKTYNIPISNIVRHGDTQDKGCPATIMKNKKWDYILEEIKKRNNASKPIGFDTSALNKSDMTANESIDIDTSSGGGITVQLVFANDGYTTVQESLPNANTSDNWIDMHKIKGMTLHMYPPYQMSCEVIDMEKFFKEYNWTRNFHYKVDYKTKVDYSTKVPLTSGIGRGGNDIGSSLSDFVLVPGDGVYSGGIINVGGGSSSDGGASGDSNFTGDTPEEICFNFFKSKGCSTQAACGILGNAKGESNFSTTVVNPSSGCTGLFQWGFGREKNMQNAAKEAGRKWDDITWQLEFAWFEFTGKECASGLKNYGGLSKFQNLTNVKDACIAWEVIFERSGGQGNSKRIQYAEEFYEKFKNYTPPSGGSGGTVSGVFGWPIPGQKTIPNRGYFGDPRDGGSRKHKGIDISCAQGIEIKSYASGTVEVASYGYNSGRGNYVKINHGSGTYSLYAHIMPNGIKVKVGDKVSGGQTIALVGNTGASTGPHLHFEVWKNSTPVNPLDWVKVGGGTKSSGTRSSVFSTKDLQDNPTTYDNIDRTQILFSSYDNKQHTYIDRALFNNQHPKYTVSIGAFFDDESSEPEKSANITDSDKGWPRSEKKLIQQTAQALYFEGFTSKHLWREFDLTRAPSPFLYLDRAKWKLFLTEVDKQVEWLVKKYGQVTSAYVPYDLLENTNTNQFIEMSPDLGIDPNIINIALGGNGNSNTGSTTKLTSLDGGFWIGDGTLNKLETNKVITDKVTVMSKRNIQGDYFFGTNNGQKNDKTKEFPSSPDYVYFQFGGTVHLAQSKETYIQKNQTLLDKLIEMYPNVPIFVGKTVPVGEKYQLLNKESLMDFRKKYDETFKNYCNTKSLYFLDSMNTTPTNFLDDNGYLKNEYAHSDQYWVKDANLPDQYENIKQNILNTEITISSSSGGGDDGNGGGDDGNNGGNDNGSNNVYDNTYGYINTLCKLYRKETDTKYSTIKSMYRYDEVKILTDVVKGYYYVSYKGQKGYVKPNNVTKITQNTYGYTYKDYINKKCSVWENTALYNKASITSGIKVTYPFSQGATIIDTAVNFYKISVNGIEGWVKAYRISVSDSDKKSIDELTTYKITRNNFTRVINADPSKVGCIACLENDSAILLDAAKEDAKELSSCFKGDEFIINGSEKEFYKVKSTSSEQSGYLYAKDLIIFTIDKYGKADKENINKTGYVKYNYTEIYKEANINTEIPLKLNILDQCKVLDVAPGFYKIKFVTYSDKTSQLTSEGWIKAYRLTTDKNSFDFEKEDLDNNIGNVSEVEITNRDFEYYAEIQRNSKDDNTSTDENTNSSSIEELKKTGWETEGEFVFDVIDNPKFGEADRFTYRGEYFARIKNDNKSLAGIKQDIVINSIKDIESELEEDSTDSENESRNSTSKDDNGFIIRVSAWLKQVTQKDINNATDAIDELLDAGITYYILDKNKNVVASAKVPLSRDTTKFAKRTVIFAGIKPGNYTFMIGGKHKFDIFADDFIIEQVYDYNKKPGDFIGSGNIGSSGVGNTAFDNGGIMIYSQAKPVGGVEPNPPAIETIITQKEYEDIMKNSERFLIDNYVKSFEPYDKGLEEILNAGIMTDDRLNTLTEVMNTFTGNTIRYCVVEAGPGSTDHCVKPADELNVLYKQVEVNSEPIYPDLIIPPNYSTGESDINSENSIPLQAMQDGTLKDKDILNKHFSFDYKTLENKEKKSKGKILNYNDPYPYDDKITELEEHYPKVKIDELESRLYSCNHPGCPVAHPMAKNFAMLSDSAIAQSKRIEQRLARIENVLSTMIRNVGRIGSRMHINCVYYGGQDIFGKYKTIRCTNDDRLHDGASVTLDQCLCCTRYEPILGQIYDILDETGFNGSAILDDMQMSYMELNDFKNLNRVERRSSKFDYANVNIEEKNKPVSLLDKWNKEDLETYKKNITKDMTNKDDIKKATENIQKSDYSFVMNWKETEIDTQAPDVKPYPNEGLKTKYYISKEKADDVVIDSSLDQTIDKDTITNINNIELISKGEWIDTRKIADTVQANKYTSEDFYFDNFNLNRTGYEYDNGLKGYVGLNVSGGGSIGDVSGSVSGNGSEVRNKIVEYAHKVHNWHKEGKAQYSSSNQNYDPDNLKTVKGTLAGCTNYYAFDCSSFTSTCYKYAGLTSLFNKTCSGGTIMAEIVNNGGEMWLADEAGVAKALPGDCIAVCRGSNPTQSDMTSRKKLPIKHIMIYVGNNQVIHASQTAQPPKGIPLNEWNSGHWNWGKSFFIRPKDLIEADKLSTTTTTDGTTGKNIDMKEGTIDELSYVCKLNSAKITAFGGETTNDSKMRVNKTVASHNLPKGTQLYIPATKGITDNEDGIWEVQDSGNHCFDFDLYLSNSKAEANKIWDKNGGNVRSDVYVIKWGDGEITSSYSEAIEQCNKEIDLGDTPGAAKYHSAWNDYMTNGGVLTNLWKFKNDDKFIKNKSWYDKI